LTTQIIEYIENFGLKIESMLEHMDKKELENIYQAIIEYKENREKIHGIDYLW